MSANLQSDKIENLDKIQDGLFYSIGESDISIDELMNGKFILENTDFDTWENLLGAAGIKNENDLTKPDFNEFVKAHTRFRDWELMLIHASNQYAARREDEQLF
ncbi:MAG TPA: hypothetical protein VGB00_14225 [Pyrinomonadaceae bacterium]|jgi:hypothetical protein